MVEQKEYMSRRQALLQQMQTDEILIIPSAAIVSRNSDTDYLFRQQSDFYYLSGFNEPNAVLILAPGRQAGEAILFNREKDALAEMWSGKRAGQQGACEVFGFDQALAIANIEHMLPELLQNRRNIYYNLGANPHFDQIVIQTINALQSKPRTGIQAPVQITRINELVHEKRLIKSPSEIALMREAANISALAHTQLMKICQPGMYEYELDAAFQYQCHQRGLVSQAYGGIFAGGNNACILHYVDNNQLLNDGELVLVDAGGENQYYASDITRTFPVNGHFTPEQRAIYEIVLAAQLAGIEKVKPGTQWHEIQAVIVRIITEGLAALGILQGDVETLVSEKKYQSFYMHNSGHWLGLDTHDVGNYKPGNHWRALKENMVLTVEPGIYISENNQNVDEKWRGIGIRIEDDIRVTTTGNEVLSDAAPKTIDDIEALMK